MIGRGAGRDNSQIRTFESVHDGQLPGDHVDDRTGHKERRNLAHTACSVGDLGILDQRQPADTGADAHPDLLALHLVQIQSGIAQRIDTCRQTVMNEGVKAPHFLGRQITGRVKIAHLTSDFCGEGCGIETTDWSDTGTTRGNRLPSLSDGITDRGDDPKAGHHNAATSHAEAGT